MRTASQLRAAALDTGTFLNYVGDGASVPWLEAGLISVGFAGLLLGYKYYLDANWPASFKLHDWCYTPYGALISCERIEADHALYEEIVRTSPVDAWTVYTAVRAGGGPWFGKSMTGYTGLHANRGVTNIGDTTQNFILGDP